MLRSIGICLLASLISQTTVAAEVHECSDTDTDTNAGAWMIAEPWEDNTERFANGQVRLAVLDTVSPAASAFHLLVLSPPFDVPGGVTCQVISSFETSGYGHITRDGLRSRYDPSQGLIFDVPITTGPDVDMHGTLVVVLNQTTGVIVAEDVFP